MTEIKIDGKALQVETGVPVPEATFGGKAKWITACSEMPIGGSVVLPLKDARGFVSALNKYGKPHGYRGAMRKQTETEYRVWKVSTEQSDGN